MVEWRKKPKGDNRVLTTEMHRVYFLTCKDIHENGRGEVASQK